jgi:hypothetical protein
MTRNILTSRATWTVLLVWVAFLIACQDQSLPAIPPVSQFKAPAVGTPIPAGKETAPISLPSDVSGVMFINQSGVSISVVVSDTVATIPRLQSFLFVLSAGTHQFYIYRPGVAPGVHSETTEYGKVRYVYVFPRPQ